MRDDQGLHRGRVLLHQVADAGVRVDDDLVGQPHLAAPVALLVGDELLAVAPVTVVHRHPDRGIGVHHLLGGDDLELIRIGVQTEALSSRADHVVVALDQLEAPVARIGKRCLRPGTCGKGLLQGKARRPDALGTGRSRRRGSFGSRTL
jgi:hypothetical protein